MNKLLIATSLMALTVVSQANAADDRAERWPRWYVGLSGGVTFLNDTDLSGGATGNMDYKTGGIITGSLGYMPAYNSQPLSGMRFEFELGYHYNGTDSLVLSGTPTASDGYVQAFSYMGNIYYDFRNQSQYTPYLGAGAGGASVTLSSDSNVGNTDTSDDVFAYQFMAGISYAPTTIPMTEWTLGYRYFVLDSPEFNSGAGKIELDDVASHNVEIGGRFRF